MTRTHGAFFVTFIVRDRFNYGNKLRSICTTDILHSSNIISLLRIKRGPLLNSISRTGNTSHADVNVKVSTKIVEKLADGPPSRFLCVNRKG